MTNDDSVSSLMPYKALYTNIIWRGISASL